MTRARGDEKMSGEEVVEEEEEGALDLVEGSFKKLVLEWSGPDLVYFTVKDWILSDQSGKPTVGNFFQYCFDFSENLEEDYELNLWMLNLVAHHVAEEECWMDSADGARDWGSELLTSDWEVPPPVWAKNRARVLEEKENVPMEEKFEENLEDMTSSPLDPSWGKGLPAPTPTVAAPSTPVWRPWEELEVVNLSVGKKRKKRRSPAAAARSRFRLLQWQEKVDRSRPNSGSRTTPLRPVGQMRGTRLLGRLESQRGGESHHSGAGRDWVEGGTVFFSNQNQTTMLPQSFQSPKSTFAPVMSSPSSLCGNVVTRCPTCYAWGLSPTA